MHTTTTTHDLTATSTDRKSRSRRVRKTVAAVLLAATAAGAGAVVTLPGDDGAKAASRPSGSVEVPKDGGQPDPSTGTDTGTPSSSTQAGSAEMLHRPGEETNGQDNGSFSTIAEYMEYVVSDVYAFWADTYSEWGLQQQTGVNYLFLAPGVPEQVCGLVTSDDDFFYCNNEEDIIVASQAMAVDMWNGTFVVPHPVRPDLQGLRNLTDAAWNVTLPDGDVRAVEPGKSVRIAGDTVVDFGVATGRIRA
jgi:hypothetical protein